MASATILQEVQLNQTPITRQVSETDNYEEDITEDQMQEVEEDDGTTDEEGWQRVPLAKKRQPTRTDRVSRSRHLLQLRPLAKIKIRNIPRHAIASAIGLTAPSPELAEMAAVTFDDAANSAHITLYDESHATKLAKIDHLSFR